jgi:hypothetical protein
MNEHYKILTEENSAILLIVFDWFYVLKPEKLKLLDCIDYITVKQFRRK